MQIIEDPRKNVGSAIGGGLGQGLSQGFQQMFGERYRQSQLATGLEKLGQKAGQLTPLQQLIEAYKIPGFTAEHAYNLVPLLQQEAKRREGIERAGAGRESVVAGSEPILPQGAQTQPTIAPREKVGQVEGQQSIKPIESTRIQLQPWVEPSIEDKLARASELSQLYPRAYPTPQDAMQDVEKQVSTDRANFREQQGLAEKQDALREKIQKRLYQHLDIEKTGKNIPGTVLTNITRAIENELANPNNKLSEEQLVKKYGDYGKNLAKSLNELNTRRESSFLSGEYSPSKIVNTLKQTRSDFEKLNALEEYKDLIGTMFGLSPEMSNYFAYPPDGKIKKMINNIPKYSIGAMGLPDPKEMKKLAIKFADDLTRQLDTSEDSNDSIQSIMRALRDKEIDVNAFLERINQNEKAGLWSPNARQRRELAKGQKFFPSLGDIYLTSFLGNNSLWEPE